MNDNLEFYYEFIKNHNFNPHLFKPKKKISKTLFRINLLFRNLFFRYPKIGNFLWLFKKNYKNNIFVIKSVNLNKYIEKLKSNDFLIFRVTHVFLEFYVLYDVVYDYLCRLESFKNLNDRDKFYYVSAIIKKKYRKYDYVDNEFHWNIINLAKTQQIVYFLNFEGSPSIFPSYFPYHYDKEIKSKLIQSFIKHFNINRIYDGLFFKKMITQNPNKFLKFIFQYKLILLANPDFKNLYWMDKVDYWIKIPYGTGAYNKRENIFSSINKFLLNKNILNNYLIISQCGGELSFWFQYKLLNKGFSIKIVDIGQALNIWLGGKASHRTTFNDFINR